MGIKNPDIQVIAVFVTRTKLSKTDPRPKNPLRDFGPGGLQNRADQIICESPSGVSERRAGSSGFPSPCETLPSSVDLLYNKYRKIFQRVAIRIEMLCH